VQSATTLGRGLGLSAQEMNFALAEAGLLVKRYGVWALTELGERYAEETSHHRGPGGYSWYNRDWETRRWEGSVIDLIGEVTPERRRQLSTAVAAARRAAREASLEVVPVVTTSVAVGARGANKLALRPGSSVYTAVGIAAMFGLASAGSAMGRRWKEARAAAVIDETAGNPS
jgi:hypothetical protein